MRLAKRFATVLAGLVAQPTASIPLACGTWAKMKAGYCFWSSPSVTPAAIRFALVRGTRDRISPDATILAIQGTTSLDFPHHPATRDLKLLTPSSQQGLFVHSVLVATVDEYPANGRRRQGGGRLAARR